MSHLLIHIFVPSRQSAARSVQTSFRSRSTNCILTLHFFDFVYPMSILLYRQHAQHTVIIDSMHTMHTNYLLSSNEWIRNNINRLIV